MYKLTDKYYIAHEPNNIILKKKVVVQEGKTKGEVKYFNVGYFSRYKYLFDTLVRKLIEDGAAREEILPVSELTKLIKEVKAQVEDISKQMDADTGA